jgi:uncharacterized protein
VRPFRGRLVLILLGIAGLLFAGRWTAAFLADRWWAGYFSPEAAALTTRIHLLQLALDVAGVLSASAWFVANLIAVTRAVGSVQVPRHVGNLEFRETLTPALLLAGAVGTGVVLGLLVGLDTSDYWRVVALAWRGVSYGLADPLLSRDAGLYVAQLPLWRALHSFALLLVLVALASVLALYTIIGAVRMLGGRVAVNDHARAHIGWLLSVFAACLAWGYLLEPYELVAAASSIPSRQLFDLTVLVAPALAGTALMVAVLSALWALRPRHALAAAGWVVLLIASVGGHRLLPLVGGRDATPAIGAAGARHFAEAAFGLDDLPESGRTALPAAPPRWVSRWDAGSAGRAAAQGGVVSVDPAVIVAGTERRPAWLVVRPVPGGAAVVALADDRLTAAGGPMYYRAADSLAYPTPYPYVELSANAVRPGAAAHALSPDAHGPAVGAWPRRVALAWALQAPELLGSAAAGTKVAWRLQPTERLSRLAPFAEWSSAVAAIAGGRLVWLADGYVSAETFPLVEPLEWRAGISSSVRAGFLGTVDAESGETHVYRRPGSGPLAAAWAALAGGVVEDSAAVPSAIAALQSYPVELFRLQSLALERAPWGPGGLAARPSATPIDPAEPQPAWRADGRGVTLLAAFDRGARRVAAVLEGTVERGRDHLELVRIDSAASIPTAAVLAARWSRFPTYDQLHDSIAAAGSRLEARPVHLWVGPDGIGATQSHIAVRAGVRPVIAWEAVAVGDRMGAARSLTAAWDNLRGASGPLPPGAGAGTLAEARRWVRLADSALRRGEWAAFGRAFDALRQALDAEPDSAGQ